mmetsp:Transcript_13535/g.47784  ORF Transcript_13535/g.47784 Transcript_13535/m.47784 type:complete len:206 (+) Transcript_13535:963-1580(+)
MLDEELQRLPLSLMFLLVLRRLDLVVCILEHDLEAQVQGLRIFQASHAFQQVVRACGRFRSVEQVPPATPQDVGAELRVMLREVVTELLEHVEDHTRGAHLELAQLAEIPHSPDLRLDEHRVLDIHHVLQLLREAGHHVVRHILHVRSDSCDEPGMRNQEVQLGPLDREQLVGKRSSIPFCVPLVEELNDDVINLLSALGLRRAC